MSLIAAAGPAWEEIKSVVTRATKENGILKGATFYQGPVIPVNFRMPAVISMERSVAPLEQTYGWGVARMRIRFDVLSGFADPGSNLEHLEDLADALLDLFWNNRQLNGTVRDSTVEEVSIGEVEERPEYISAKLVLQFDVEFQRPI